MNKKCTDKYIEEIRVREKAATPGPWTLLRDGSIEGESHVCHCRESNIKDASFICHSRTDIPVLLAEVEWLTKENTTMKKALELACNDKMDCPAIWNKKPPFKQCKNCKSGENFEECWYRYFIQQAQKQEKK